MENNLIVLYFGDNGMHEFWESKDQRFLLIRNHGERQWQALYIDGQFVNTGDRSAKSLVKQIERDYGFRFVFNADQRWLKFYPHHRNMKLVTIPQPSY